MEFVYVVSRDKLFPDCYPQGLTRFGDEASIDHEPMFVQSEVTARIKEHGFFVERPYAERSVHLKQVIPYTIVVAEDPIEGPRILMVRRLPQGGEQRLVGKLSIGIGGHINPVDGPDGEQSDVIEAGTARELDEELNLGGERRLEAIGLINDDANPVGAVHVGLVQVLYLAPGEAQHASVKEVDVLEGTLVSPSELRRLRDEGANFETWSRMLVEHLDQLLNLAQPSFS